MALCADCGREDISYYLINGFCEDCIEYNSISEWNDEDEDGDKNGDTGNVMPLDPVLHLLQTDEI
ncbi:hypothetical protein [Bacillus sp. ISL-7]|uniref:hypothetical protein n=1 Tax=Bacillus sp. ISL-7 TaxID=2819136 RepID=UPI001BEC3264|nr:hypothetical protein [Bacillus sp. ISL-7]MBT2734688.1 hypothetical protein [Bacillus sp. ISL-7]